MALPITGLMSTAARKCVKLRGWHVCSPLSLVLRRCQNYCSTTPTQLVDFNIVNPDQHTQPAPTNLETRDIQPTPPPPIYMDTYKIIGELTKAGYSEEQAEAVVSLLTKSLQTSVNSLTTEHVKRHELDFLSLRLRGDLESLRSNVVLIEKGVVESLRKDNQTLRGQIEKLMSEFKEEVAKVQSGLRLDLNLERSRIKEEATGLQQLIKDTNNTIDKEVAQLKTQIESQKLESIKYLAGGIFSLVTIMLSVVLGLWRLLGK